MPRVEQPTAPEPQAAPLPFPCGSCTGICPVIGSRAVLAQGCPVIQIPCYEKAEASRASWGQICHVALDSSCRLSSAQNLQCKVRHSRRPLLLQIPACSSPSPVLHRSLGLPVPHRFGYAACRVEVTYPHHTPPITQHHYPFRRIHVLKNFEKPCCLNGLILAKVPRIHFHFHLWTFYSAPNIETYSTKSTHASLLSPKFKFFAAAQMTETAQQ